MKNWKVSRVFAVLMALTLCVSMVTPAFAERWITMPDGTQIDLDQLGSEDSSTITVPCSHELEWTTTVPATCTASGTKTGVCKCGEKTETETIAALGHNMKYDSHNSSTHTYKCTRCGDTETASHSMGAWVTVKEATYEEAGREECSCSACGYVQHNTLLSGKDKEAGWISGGPSIGTGGTTKSQCEKDGHPTTETVTKPATCTEAGEKTIACECGEVSRTETITATGHAWGEWVTIVEPEDGHLGLIRRVCGNDASHIDEMNVQDPFIGTIITPCDQQPKTWEITTPATCTEPGVETGTCECGKHTTTRPIAAIGHAYGEWTVTTPATGTEAGEQTRVCANDSSHTETQEIPATGTTPVTPVTPVTPAEDVEINEPDVPLAETPAEELEVIEDGDVPLAELPEEEPAEEPLKELEVIEDEAVPLSDVPQTGEASTILWMAAVLATGAGLVYVNTGKRRQNAR